MSYAIADSVVGSDSGKFLLPSFRKLWVAQFVSIFGDFLALFGVIGPCAHTVAVAADEPKTATPQVVLADTFNAVTRVYFNNTAVTKARTSRELSSDDFAPTLNTG